MKTLRIAVSGDKGSFSEEAGLLYAQRNGLKASLVYSVEIEKVLRSVAGGKTDLGIFPVVNSRGGLVQTAYEAMGGHLFAFLGELWLEVHQCLLALPRTPKSRIRRVASHPQALSQCERYLKKEFPDAELVEWEDTAKAAKDLSKGTLPPDTAVIAPARSAGLYGLQALAKGIQDHHPNLTTFIIVGPRK